ncbi:MAG: DNA recombination protein RmuC, partial [Nautilia sp.]
FSVFLFIQNKKILEKIKSKEDELSEVYDKLQLQIKENAILNEKINYLIEMKEDYEQIQEIFVKDKERLQELKILKDKLEKDIFQKDEKIAKKNVELKELRDENINLKIENQELKIHIEENNKLYEEKMEFLKKSEEKLKESFKNLANDILEETNKKIVENSKENLSQILNPLQTQMKEFRDKIEFLNRDEVEKISALQNELKNLKELSIKLSSDAENLTKALKGESKIQGNWGELVLERVLELSGLEKGREYEREITLNDLDNKRYRPDVIIHLPDNRDVIVDAKTSLNAYQDYIKTEDKKYIKTHIQALKNHIDKLAEKKYENLKNINSLDFIFMFVPIENALLLALENDSTLFEYAFKKRVILVSPTTLLVSLRAIENSWRFKKQVKNIEEIIKIAENLYDKVRGFTEDFEKIGKSIDNMATTYRNAKNKLTDGRGNVIRQIELLKEKSGIKPKKEISKDLVDVVLIRDNN